MADLFENPINSKVIYKGTYVGQIDPSKVAVHYISESKKKDDVDFSFDCVDVFEMDPHSNKIRSVRIIYDTYRTRIENGKIE